jgi:hypothetical protein
MKLVSQFEAASRSTAELHGLLTKAFNAFATARAVASSAAMLWHRCTISRMN